MAKSKLKAPKLKAPKLKSPKICTSNMCIMVLLLFILFFVLYTQTNIFNNKIIEGNNAKDQLHADNCKAIYNHRFDKFIEKLKPDPNHKPKRLHEDQIHIDILATTVVPYKKCHYHERINALLDQNNCPGDEANYPRYPSCTPITETDPITTKKDNSNYKISKTSSTDETKGGTKTPQPASTTPKPSTSLGLPPF